VVGALVVGLWGCAGSDGHPPVVDTNVSPGGSGGSNGEGGRPANTAGKENEPEGEGLLDGGFIEIATVNDIYLDEPRGVLYVSTNEGGLATVNLETGKISTREMGQGPLMGLDLSPSGRYLAICENSVDKETKEYWVHLLDLEEDAQRTVYLPQGFDLREGSHSVAFASDETLFATQSYIAGGYTDFLQVSLVDDTWSSSMGVRDDSMLARSADNSRVVLVEPKDGGGPVTIIDSASLEVTHALAEVSLHDLALNADGSLLVLPTDAAVKFMDLDAAGGATVRESHIKRKGRLAAAVALNPADNSLFVAWSKGVNNEPATLERYDLDTLESLGVLNANIPLARERKGDFELVRMKVTSDGTLLFVTLADGIMVYAL
jgi:hypothetical protein